MIYGWTDKDLLNSWSFIFPLTEQSKRDGCLPLTHPAWHNTPNPWWRFSLDQPPLLPLGQRTSNTSGDRLQSDLSEISLDLLERELGPVEICLRKFLMGETTRVLIQGTLPQLKLIQTLSFTESFTLGTVTRQMQLQLLEHAITLAQNPVMPKEELRQVGWKWMTTKWAFAQECESFSPSLSPKMNILVWNCRGAMKPSFRSTIRDLKIFHSPSIVVVTETRISGSRAGEILHTLPYDGIHTTDPIGYARGIWLLWRRDMVDMDVLTAMKQEIHAIVKVLSSPSPWLLSSIYGSPRFEERQILWDNLCSVSFLHGLP